MIGAILAYMAAVNAMTFAMFAWDKRAAQTRAWRVPERRLLGLAALGGSPAALVARQILRHKTRKEPFGTILVWILGLQAGALAGARAIETPAAEPWGANVLRAGRTVLVQAGCPRTADRVANAGYDVRLVDVSELAKAEGSLTCLSLLFDADLDGDLRVKRGT